MKSFFMLMLLIVVQFCTAQQLQYSDQRLGKWMSFRSNTWLTKNVALYAERNYRHYQILPSIEQFAFRIGAFYRADSSRFMFGGGYASLKNVSPEDEIVEIYQSEMRLWQHVSYAHVCGRLHYDFRYRAEQRLINNVYLRHRLRLQNTIPLNKPKMEKNTVYFYSELEFFLNSTPSYYDRTRYHLSLGYMPFTGIHVMVGFSHDFNEVYNRKYFNFTFAYDVDLTKKINKK